MLGVEPTMAMAAPAGRRRRGGGCCGSASLSSVLVGVYVVLATLLVGCVTAFMRMFSPFGFRVRKRAREILETRKHPGAERSRPPPPPPIPARTTDGTEREGELLLEHEKNACARRSPPPAADPGPTTDPPARLQT